MYFRLLNLNGLKRKHLPACRSIRLLVLSEPTGGLSWIITMKQIPLTQGKFAIVDDKDYSRVIQYKWFAHCRHNYWYAYRSIKKGNKRTMIAMHRFILDTPKGMEVDHKDFNGLNNRRNNIRNCTRAQNQQHRRKKKNKTSKYMGVSWNKREKCWYAQVRRNGKTEVLARTTNEVEAAKAYDKRARELYGEFANTNF